MSGAAFNRREILAGGFGLMALRALASGIPAALLSAPAKAWSEDACQAVLDAQFLILSSSQLGDALNCNVPGTYASDMPVSYPANLVTHPSTPSMAPTPMSIGGRTFTAAAPWAQLSAETLARTSFIHHRTQTANHGDMLRVQKLMGNVRRNEMLVSYTAKHLSTCLGTVQPQPIALGSEVVSYLGQYLPRLTPTGVAALLKKPADLQATLQSLRDGDLDRINAALKQSRATTAQRQYLDRMASSQQQIRKLAENISDDLSLLKSDDQDGQALAAVLLAKMGVAPVMTLHIGFGGDNHFDANLEVESEEHVKSVATIQSLLAKLKAYGLEDKVTFAMLNVFGRTFNRDNGRDHHAAHNVAVLIGKNVKGSVIGGLSASGKSMDFDATSGLPADGANIAAADSLAAVGYTLGRALGAPDSVLSDPINGIDRGQVITAALR